MTIAKSLTMILLGLLALAAPPVLAEGPERIDLPAPRMGTVPFPHELHQERALICQHFSGQTFTQLPALLQRPAEPHIR